MMLTATCPPVYVYCVEDTVNNHSHLHWSAALSTTVIPPRMQITVHVQRKIPFEDYNLLAVGPG